MKIMKEKYICGMKINRVKNFRQIAFSFLMLIAFTVYILPASVFHHHHSEHNVSSTGSGLIECHNSIFKPFDQTVKRCSHKNHFIPEKNNCVLCGLQLTLTKEYFFSSTAYLKIDFNLIQHFNFAVITPLAGCDYFFAVRGPPFQLVA